MNIYGIRIKELDCPDSGTVIVTVAETAPTPDTAVTEAFTYPNCAITFPHEPPDGILIRNGAGTEFQCLGTMISPGNTEQ